MVVKRLLLLLCFVGAAVYLLAPPQPMPANDIAVAQANVDSKPPVDTKQDANKPLRTSWGSTLETLRRKPDTSAGTEEVRRYRQVAASETGPQEGKDPQPLGASDVTGSIVETSTTATDAPDQEAKRWGRITLATALYSEPSVSSTIAGYSSPGKEVQIRDYKNGWFRVQVPGTEESGWVFYKSLEYIYAPTPASTQVAATAERPANVVSTTARKPAARVAKPVIRTSDDRNVIQNRDFRGAENVKKRNVAETGKPRRGLGLFKRRKARRAWALGPAN